MFSMQSVSSNPVIATFQLSSAASLNLGRSQNGVLGNGLMSILKLSADTFVTWFSEKGGNYCLPLN